MLQDVDPVTDWRSFLPRIWVQQKAQCIQLAYSIYYSIFLQVFLKSLNRLNMWCVEHSGMIQHVIKIWCLVIDNGTSLFHSQAYIILWSHGYNYHRQSRWQDWRLLTASESTTIPASYGAVLSFILELQPFLQGPEISNPFRSLVHWDCPSPGFQFGCLALQPLFPLEWANQRPDYICALCYPIK